MARQSSISIDIARRGLVLGLLYVCSSMAAADELGVANVMPTWHGNIDSAKRAAADSGRPIMLVFR